MGKVLKPMILDRDSKTLGAEKKKEIIGSELLLTLSNISKEERETRYSYKLREFPGVFELISAISNCNETISTFLPFSMVLLSIHFLFMICKNEQHQLY